MSLTPNLLRVFYRGTEQQIKIFDGTQEEQIIKLIKRAFHISEDESRIFLQDGDGVLICLPSKVPDGLCVHVYVEPSILPTKIPNPSSDKNLLPGFKWDGTVSSKFGPPTITNDGYTLGDKQIQSQSPVVSTQSYDKGKLFTKFTIDVSSYQSIGIVSASYSGNYYVYEFINDSDPIIMTESFFDHDEFGKYLTVGIFLNLDEKYVEFIHLNDDKIMKRLKKSIPEGLVKIYACTKYARITIQEGGSSPIPSSVYKIK